MKSRNVWLAALLVGSLVACKEENGGDTLAERERQLAERERDLARQELESLKRQATTAASAAAVPVATTPQPAEPSPAAAAPAPPAPTGPRTVVISLSLTVATKKPDGQPWDALGNGPDPVLSVTAGGKTFSAGPFQDQTTASATLGPVSLALGDPIVVKVVDKDLQQNDLIGAFSTQYRGARTVQGALEGGTVSVTFR
jgi:hypothetical protein